MSSGPQDDVLEQVLAHPHLLSLVYQPIVDLQRAELVGYEALARLPGEDDTQAWFDRALARGVRTDLELLVLEQVVDRLPAVPAGRFLSVNVSLDAVADERTQALVARAGVHASRLLLELTDTLPLDDASGLLAAVEPLRQHGVRVAVHVGPWHQALESLSTLRPDVVKLRSRSGAGQLGHEVALAESVAQYSGSLGASVVVTVLEAADDLLTVSDAHAAMAQGYVLGRPDVVMSELSPQALGLLTAGGAGEPARGLDASARRGPGSTVAAQTTPARDVVGVFSAEGLTKVLEGLAAR